jgi:hypothetical protein
MPKIGPFRALAFQVPTPQAEKLFITSFDDTLGEYRKLIAETQQNQLHLINENFDTGQPTRFGQYRMADAAYEKLLEKLGGGSDKTSADKTPGIEVSKDLRDNIVAFYQGSPGPKSEKARSVLAALKNQSASVISPPPSPSQLSVPSPPPAALADR